MIYDWKKCDILIRNSFIYIIKLYCFKQKKHTVLFIIYLLLII